ncbi:MAG: aspartate kinase, monofunctional class [Sphaerobacter sp.]|nr:aspartate kinase, monofunctional class [Sphaerobacter sp.]
MRVMKFGGTSVGSGSAIAQTVSILSAAHQPDKPVIAVVSAMSGVTNLLLGAAEDAAHGRLVDTSDLRHQLLDRHLVAAAETIRDARLRQEAATAVAALADQCLRLVESVQVLGDLSPRVNDWIVSFGERMSSRLVAAVLQDRGVPAEAVDADQVIITDGVFGAASPLFDRTREAATARLRPLLDRGVLPVVTGYFGADESGATTTLGRGGSDFSAAVIGSALDAEEIIIWTDVDGVMTADPRLVPEASTLPAVSFAEATELAYFGAKVIHPRTMQLPAERGIPIWIRNTFRPDHPGTRIGPEPVENGAVKAITAIPGLSVITVEGAGLLSVAGVTARVFSAVARVGINVFMISQASSQHSLSFVVRGADARAAVRVLEEEFELDLLRARLLRVWEDPDLAIVAVVGAGMRGTPGVAGRVFQALGAEGINIVSIAQGSSELNISCVIAAADVARAVPALHRAFELGRTVR